MDIVTGMAWSPDEIKILKTYYASTTAELLQKLLPGRSVKSIYLKAFKLGLRRDCHIPWSEEENEIIRKYYPKLGSSKLLEMLPGRTGKALADHARLLGVHILSDYKRRAVLGSLDFFSIPTVLSSYWAGFIAADGCINDGNRLTIGLSVLDKEHLERFCLDIGYPGERRVEVNHGKGGKLVRFGLRSKTVVRDLEQNYGIKPRKSFDLDFPSHLDFENTAAFIAGLIDGDGCIRLVKNKESAVRCYLSVDIVGTKNVLLGVKEFADRYSPLSPNVAGFPSSVKPCSSIYSYRINGYRALTFTVLIMRICKDIPLLERKWDVAVKYQELLALRT